jgi:type III restriction enzyme
LRTVSKEYRLIDFGVHLVRSAINKLPFYQFANLKRHLPELSSISAFITSPDYLGSIRLEVYGLEAQLENLTQKEKLDITIRLLEQIAERMVGQTIDEEEPASLAEVE